MFKRVHLGDKDPVTLEPRASVVFKDSKSLEKTASKIQEYVFELKPVQGRTLIHLISVGSYEFYGPNRNKDAFAEAHHGDSSGDYLPHPALGTDYNGLIESFNGLPVYETFGTANAFLHHKNKDPNNRVGEVLKPFYNDAMHRVELIISLANDKCSDYIQRIDSGENLAFSMGCHIKYDVCSVCGNRAPSRADYCDHAKNMYTREFTDNGLPVCVFNPNAKFFDISIVSRPADRIGYMLKKVAEDESSCAEGERERDHAIRSVYIRKLSEIDKAVSAEPVSAVKLPDNVELALKTVSDTTDHGEDFNADDFKAAADVLHAAVESATPLSFKEVTSLVLRKHAWASAYVNKLAALRQEVYSALASNPDLIDVILDGRVLNKTANYALPESFVEKRSCADNHLLKQAYLVGLGHKPAPFPELMHMSALMRTEEPENTKVYKVTDPETGEQKVTNQDAVNQAKTVSDAVDASKILGAGALTAGAFKAVTGAPFLPTFALTSAALGGKHLIDSKLKPGTMPTDSGEYIPKDTVLFDKQSALMTARSAILDARIPCKEASGKDYSEMSFASICEHIGKLAMLS